MNFEAKLSRSPYRFVRPLGEGRAGIVLEVLHRDTGERFALKLFLPLSDEAIEIVESNFQSLAPIHHPNLVRLEGLLSLGERLGLVMELAHGVDILRFLRGEGLDDERAERRMLFGQIVQPLGKTAFSATPSAIARLKGVTLEIAQGLSALHEENQIHGDIQPSNLLVSPEGSVKILDLISEYAPDDPARFAGVAAYMAPEHGMGKTAGPASDLYSLGVVLFEALSGELPFAGSGREIFVRKNTVSAPRLGLLVKNLPDEFDELVAKLLDRRPSARPSAKMLIDWLEGGRPLDVGDSD